MDFRTPLDISSYIHNTRRVYRDKELMDDIKGGEEVYQQYLQDPHKRKKLKFRKVVDVDFTRLFSQIEAVVKSTGYRNRVRFRLKYRDSQVEIIGPHAKAPRLLSWLYASKPIKNKHKVYGKYALDTPTDEIVEAARDQIRGSVKYDMPMCYPKLR